MRMRPLVLAATAATAAGLAVLAPTAASAAPSATPSAAPSSATTCDRAAWEAKVQGAPRGFGAGSPGGDYLWHDTSGFHLRVTHGGNHDQRVYSGVVHSSAPMHVEPVRLERGDAVTVSADHRTMTFVFANHGYVDGVDFHTYCARDLTVSRLHVGSSDLPATHVYLGATKAHPAGVPFTVHRA